ncbi:type II toxin-antitoxin system PemK/MazF family toxin [Clostridium chromiireducens]|uniref:PemK-like protein n=1 Tax=Clostridium chromiireducens TaxID=225345 RepID=A0A1V4IUE4_9CLOT|nr:type II toxin-antitoxin system PemK/MazF family toxin [Clostridium chromiireducens]OPJ63661.1 PemK-like protein [Clostridium chromiireducens]
MDKKQTLDFVEQEIEKFKNNLKNICNKDDRARKKAELVTYWIRDYIKYLNFEEKFSPKKLKEYARGDVIKVNFGFNIGNEEGGLHYALVIDNDNSQASGVVTVVPLSTEKAEDNLSKYDVSLGNELNILVENKLNLAIETIKEENEKLQNMLTEVEQEIDKQAVQLEIIKNKKSAGEVVDEDAILAIQKNLNSLNEKLELELSTIEINKNKMKIKYAEKILKEFERMNLGTKALVGQITTISKMRIFDPKYSSDVLDGIRLSPEQLNKVNSKIKELYIFSIDK